MSKKTAFGGDNHYQDFKAEGLRIARDSDLFVLKVWLKRLRSDEQTEVQQAAAVLHSVSDHSPQLFVPFVKELVKVLHNSVHPAGPRFTYRLLAEISIPEKFQGEVVNASFKDLTNSRSPIAIKVFAMSLIANHMRQYPELAYELEAALRLGYRKGSAGYKSRARKIANTYGLRLDENM
ncbi:MAG: hypothetical protein WBG42_12445 [Cryomorphaceae bacterium]